MLSQTQKAQLKKEYLSLIDEREQMRSEGPSLGQAERLMVAQEMAEALDTLIAEVHQSNEFTLPLDKL